MPKDFFHVENSRIVEETRISLTFQMHRYFILNLPLLTELERFEMLDRLREYYSDAFYRTEELEPLMYELEHYRASVDERALPFVEELRALVERAIQAGSKITVVAD